jgi:hypothetical protein
VTVRDSNGNPVEGQAVQLASSGSNNILSSPSSRTPAVSRPARSRARWPRRRPSRPRSTPASGRSS